MVYSIPLACNTLRVYSTSLILSLLLDLRTVQIHNTLLMYSSRQLVDSYARRFNVYTVTCQN